MKKSIVALIVFSSMIAVGFTSQLSNAQTKFPLTIKHDLGTTEIKEQPRRVVAFSEEAVELLAALEVKPVGFASQRIISRNLSGALIGQPFSGITFPIAATLENAAFLGGANQPSLEAITVSKPDLIVAYTDEGTYLKGDGYAQLSKIAPTLAYNFRASNGSIPWQSALEQVAQALGREAAARAYIADFRARIASYKSKFKRIVARSPRITIMFMPNPNVNFMLGSQSGFVPILQQLGFTYTVPTNVNLPGNTGGPVALEVLPTFETDVVIALRLRTAAGELGKLPAEELLGRGKAKVVRYVLDPLEGQSGPITDLVRVENLLKLMEK